MPLLVFTDTPPLAPDDPVVRRYFQGMGFMNLYRAEEVADQAARLAAELRALPPGRRAVTPFYILSKETKTTTYTVDAVAIYRRGLIDGTRDTALLALLAERLEASGITLDFIYCDNENDLTPWTFGIEPLKAVYSSDEALARMPRALREFDPASLKFMTPEYHQWMIHLGRYSQEIKINSLRKVLCDSGLLSPWSTATRAINFLGIRTSFRVYDFNGWEIEYQTLLDGRTSGPVAYPGPAGHRYKRDGGSTRAHHPVWNSLIDNLNHARSSAATSDIVPIIREPLRARGQARNTVDPGARWLWDQLIGHLVRTGAEQFVLFNHHTSPEESRAMARMFEHHDGSAPPARPALPEIPLDVDEIVTGDLRTTYSEFLTHDPDRWYVQP